MGSDSKMDPLLRFFMLKNKLKFNWGIVCPADCYCNNDAIKSLLIKVQELHEQYSSLGYCHPKLAQPAVALKVADNCRLLTFERWLNRRINFLDDYRYSFI